MTREPRDPREEPRDDRDVRRLDNPVDRRDARVIPQDPRDERQPGDARDERTVLDVPRGVFALKGPATIIIGAYTLLGLDILLAPDRWSNTPSYGVLLTILSQNAWGAVLLSVATLLFAATWLVNNRPLRLIAHFIAVVFTTGWLIAFIARRITDDGTTAMNPVTWSVLLAIIVYSMRLTERYHDTPPPRGGLA